MSYRSGTEKIPGNNDWGKQFLIWESEQTWSGLDSSTFSSYPVVQFSRRLVVQTYSQIERKWNRFRESMS